ncbi:unnamed protein product [Ilex paraguariensis]|uniref:Uncharacterized protein n=1 Tax=Ilex paraguariensis TaxID=185542 RepID=A0ABC8RWL3_9AQUA
MLVVLQVYGGKGEQTHRQIHLGGSAQQVALAKQRVDEYVYSQLIQKAGGQLSVSHEAGMVTTLPPAYASAATLPPVYATYTSSTANQPAPYFGQSFHASPV